VKLSVVIPVYNEKGTFEELLGRIARVPLPKEIVVEEEAVEAAAEVPASEVPAAKQAETPAAPAEEPKKEKGEKK